MEKRGEKPKLNLEALTIEQLRGINLSEFIGKTILPVLSEDEVRFSILDLEVPHTEEEELITVNVDSLEILSQRFLTERKYTPSFVVEKIDDSIKFRLLLEKRPSVSTLYVPRFYDGQKLVLSEEPYKLPYEKESIPCDDLGTLITMMQEALMNASEIPSIPVLELHEGETHTLHFVSPKNYLYPTPEVILSQKSIRDNNAEVRALFAGALPLELDNLEIQF